MSQKDAKLPPDLKTSPARAASAVIAFITDSDTEQTIRDSLSDLVGHGRDVRRGNIRTAIAAMLVARSPRALIVDLSGEEQPLDALAALSEAVEPDVILLVIGETQSIGFYRHITRDLGVTEYIFKPVSRDAVARYFGAFVSAEMTGLDTARGGRVIAIMGARGGVGATTIGANLAWYLGVIANRQTVFVEADLYLGSGALLLGGRAGTGLRMALEAPERIDPLFVERVAQAVSGRLSILAGEEKLTEDLHYAPGAAQRLIEALRLRYNFVIVNVPFLPLPVNRDFLDFSHHRVIVSDATLASVHDTIRLLELPNGRWQPQRPTIVLNRLGRIGTLTRKSIEASCQRAFDVVVPDLPALVNENASLGTPAVGKTGPFRDAIEQLASQVGFGGARDLAAGAGARAFSWRRLLARLVARDG
jgi:pilus assembly protein CpaE